MNYAKLINKVFDLGFSYILKQQQQQLVYSILSKTDVTTSTNLTNVDLVYTLSFHIQLMFTNMCFINSH